MNNAEDIALRIEALLFALGRPLSYTELAKKLSLSETDLALGLQHLSQKEGRGIVLVTDGQTCELRTAQSASALVEQVRKDEYAKDIGRAGLETLATILYRGPLSRAEIDFIRGVNSSQTLRTLLMRGLVRKIPKPKDERSFLYEPTVELLASLGATAPLDLPEYEDVRAKLTALEEAYRMREQAEQTE